MSPVHAEPRILEVPLAQQRNLSFEQAVTNVALGSPDVADVKMLGKREILVSSKKLGTTTLKVWTRGESVRDYLVRVTPSDGLRATLDDAGLDVEASGKGLLLRGEAQSLQTHAAALAAVRRAVPDKDQVSDRSEMRFKHQVQTDIKIVEISHSKLKDAGFFLSKNTSSVTAAVSPPSLLSNIVGNGSNFSLGSDSGFLPSFESFNFVLGRAADGVLGVLSVLEGNGFASALAEPSLVTLSGQDASFLVGGEFPIPVRKGSGDGSSVSIEYKEFGIRLFLTPTVLSNKQIMLRVAPEVSELDFSNGIETGGVSVPSLKVRRTETSVELGDGESFVISGLVSKDTIANIDKVPGLGDIPVLGAFFRSSRVAISDRELIMVVTPHLVTPLAANASLPSLPGEKERNYDPDFGEFMFFETGRFDSTNATYGFSD
jgi:pilus assembly protein CpaC